MISWASLMPIFGKKKRELEAHAEARHDAVREAHALREEVQRLRAYINSRMEEHFRSYSGGMLEQMKTLSTLQLPTPWVPAAITEQDWPKYAPIHTQTWVQERRMVPLREAGKV